jgi:hypothetical protein
VSYEPPVPPGLSGPPSFPRPTHLTPEGDPKAAARWRLVGILTLVGLLPFVALAVFIGRRPASLPATASAPSQVLKRPMPREVLEAAVMGQTTDVVVQRIGPPDSSEATFGADGGPTSTTWWYYNSAISDAPGYGGRTTQAMLWVTNGRVVKIQP